MRRRINAEAKRVQPRYDAKKITRDPRREIFAAADFDGMLVSQLGEPKSSTFQAFVFWPKWETGGSMERRAERRRIGRGPEVTASIFRHVVVDFVRPCVNAAFQIVDIGKATLPQQLHRIRAPDSAMAVHDDWLIAL